MIRDLLGADGGWCRRRSSKPFRGADGVPGGFDSHTLPCLLATLFLLLSATGPAPLAAQEDDPSPRPEAPADSAVTSPVVRPEARPAAAEDEARSGPAPMSAFLRSVLVPGWGQLAADQPVRAAVYFTLQTATVYMVIRSYNRIDEAEGEGLKEARREQREDWLVLAGFWALASGIDAWVSAQMWGFEGEVVPPPDGSAGLAVRMSVPVAGF